MEGVRSVGGASSFQYSKAVSTPQKEKFSSPSPVDKVEIRGEKRGFIRKTINSVVSGVGLASGAIGGGLLGASIASTGSLIQGLLASGVSWSAITAAGLTGGAIGAAIFGIAGAAGGWKISDTVAKGIKKLMNKIKG